MVMWQMGTPFQYLDETLDVGITCVSKFYEHSGGQDILQKITVSPAICKELTKIYATQGSCNHKVGL